jgi:hypothetical protein
MTGRRDSYSFDVVDPFSLVKRGTLTAFPDECSITYGYYTQNLISATIIAKDYDGGLVRVNHTIELPDGTVATEVLGTFFVESVEDDYSTGIDRQRLTCYSTHWRLSQDALAYDFSRRAGDKCQAGIKLLCEAEGATLITYGEVDKNKAHTQDFRFAAGENRLECLNTYAGWCGWILGVDDMGRQTLDVYYTPEYRSPSYVFENGQNCTYTDERRDALTGSVCNRVVARWSREKDQSNDGLGLSDYVTVDLPATAALSYESAGRRITHVLDVDPCTHAELADVAKNYLAQHDASIRYIEIEHVGIPNLRAGQTCWYITDTENLLCEITQMDVAALSPLMMTKSKLKVIK